MEIRNYLKIVLTGAVFSYFPSVKWRHLISLQYNICKLCLFVPVCCSAVIHLSWIPMETQISRTVLKQPGWSSISWSVSLFMFQYFNIQWIKYFTAVWSSCHPVFNNFDILPPAQRIRFSKIRCHRLRFSAIQCTISAL